MYKWEIRYNPKLGKYEITRFVVELDYDSVSKWTEDQKTTFDNWEDFSEALDYLKWEYLPRIP